MFRRKTTTAVPGAAPDAPPSHVAPRAAELADAGWVLPRALADGAAIPAWTLIGTVASETATAVDPAGLVVGEGWSLDWWVGADDRWHVPAREAAVRQHLVGEAPVVETLLRVPGGDAVHRAYGVRSPRGTGDEWVVVEVENRTPIPFAVALVVRPFVADAVGDVSEIRVGLTDGGRGRDVAHLVRVDGRPSVVLPRQPSGMFVGTAASGDAIDAVAATTVVGAEAVLAEAVACPAGLATVALVFPVPHTAVLRVAIPVGEVDGTERVAYPDVLPDAETVASGWEVHRRGPRLELPDRRLDVAVERARAHLQLAHDGDAVHRDGIDAPALEPGATEVILGAFDVLDRPTEVGPVVAGWIDRLAETTPDLDAMALEAISHHWLLHRVDALRDWMLPEVAAAVERIDRGARKGRLDAPTRIRACRSLASASSLLAASGQPEAAAQVDALATKVAEGIDPMMPAGPTHADRLVSIAQRLAAGDRSAVLELDAELAQQSATGAWSGPGRGGRSIGHDLAASAALVLAARSMLVSERSDGLDLLPVHPDGWYGGGVELHDAPTGFGRLSFAVRWHGTRPALLWDLEPHPGIGAVTLRVPGLDPTWSTTELRGDALLAEVTPPDGLETIRFVPDHPDIDPDMRRPGEDPGPPPPTLPDGGTFS
jgi:hypothetical protein